MEINISQLHIIYFLLAVVAISIAINLYMIRYRKTPKQDSAGEELNPEKLSVDQIEAFISQQISETKLFLKDEAPEGFSKLDSKVTALRTAYLNIEQKAYNIGPSTPPYWVFLNDKLLKLLKIFLPQLFGREAHIQELEKRVTMLKERVQKMGTDKNNSSKEVTIKTLDGFLDRFRSDSKNQKIIDRYLKKIEKKVEDFETPEFVSFYRQTREAKAYAKSSIDTLADLNETLTLQLDSVSTLEEKVTKMKEEHIESPDDKDSLEKYERAKKELDIARNDNTQLKSYIESLKKKIIKYDQAISSREDSYKIAIGQKDFQKTSDSLTEEIRNLSTEIATSTDKEVDRLRQLLNRQRTSISSLDEIVDDLREKLNLKDEEVQGSKAEIDRLKVNLRDSEVCVKTLEQQIDELMSRSTPEDTEIVSEEDFKKLNDEITRIKTELDDTLVQKEQNDELIAYFQEAIQASSLEDLAACLFQRLADCACDPAVEIRYGSKTVVASKKGSLDKKDKLLVNNMQVQEFNMGAEGRSLRFRMLNMRGVIRAEKGKDSFSEFKDNIITTLRITDRLVEKIGAAQLLSGQKKTIDFCQNIIKKAAFEIDKGLEHQMSRSKTLLSSSVGQLTDIARSAGMEDKRVVAFQEIGDEAIKELASDEALRLKTRKAFLSLIREIENL